MGKHLDGKPGWERLDNPKRDLDHLKCARSVLEDAGRDAADSLTPEIDSLTTWIKRRTAFLRRKEKHGRK